MEREEADRIASQIIDASTVKWDAGGRDSVFAESRNVLLDTISAALLAASRPASGFVRDDAGVDRRVLGTLPVTKDNCIVGANCFLYHPEVGEVQCVYEVDGGTWAAPDASGCNDVYTSTCYSSEEAALASLTPKATT